jgi:hypothetical protein
MMARRRIGQEQLSIGIKQARRGALLDEMWVLIGWDGNRPALGWDLRGSKERAWLATVGVVQASAARSLARSLGC